MADLDLRKAIGGRIRQARLQAGLSQGQVAKMLGLHRPSVSEMEAGNRRVAADELGRLAEMFDVSVAFLTGDAAETVASDDPRIQMAARELQKLGPEALDRLLTLIATLKNDKEA